MAMVVVGKRLLVIFLVLILFFNCGGNRGRTADKRVVVTFWHAMGGPLGDALEAMVRDFEQKNPEIDIQLVSMANYSSLSQKLMGAVQVNAPPTIAQMYESWTTQFYKLNKLIVIESLIEGPDGLSAEDLEDFFPAFIENNTWDGKLVTLPFNKSIPVFFYNVELLKSVGYERFPDNWRDLRRMFLALTDRSQNRYGCAGLVNEGVFGALLLQSGGAFLDEAKGEVLFNSPAGVSAMSYLWQLVNEDSTVYYGSGYESQNDFLMGKIACIQSSSVSYAFLRPNLNFRIGVAPLPVSGKPAVIGYGTNIGIFRGGTEEQIAAAWRFIKWFTAPNQQARWAKETFYVPVRKSALAIPEYRKLIDEIPGFGSALQQLDYLSFEPKSEAWLVGRRVLGEAIERIIKAGVPIRTALDQAAAEVGKELRR